MGREQGRAQHWDSIYAGRPSAELGWYEEVPSTLDVVRSHSTASDGVVDIGGGDGHLVSELSASGYRDLTVLDLSRVALERVEGNHELLADMVGLFVGEYPSIAEALQSGLASNDLDQVAAAAHQLKGNLATFAATRGSAAAAELEAMARSGDQAGAEEAWETFLEVFMHLEPELIALLAA